MTEPRPILAGGRIVGRVDPTKDRENEMLTINAVYSEPEVPKGRAVAHQIAETIDDLGGFLGAKRIIYGRKIPEGWKSWLKQNLGFAFVIQIQSDA
jgi:uncharacterized protein YcaQ